jgi:hypothetical protein
MRRSRKSPPSTLPASRSTSTITDTLNRYLLLPEQFSEPSSPANASDIVSHCSSTEISTLTPVPTSSDEWSTKAQAGESALREPLQFNYSEVDFKKIVASRYHDHIQLRSFVQAYGSSVCQQKSRIQRPASGYVSNATREMHTRNTTSDYLAVAAAMCTLTFETSIPKCAKILRRRLSTLSSLMQITRHIKSF